MTGQLKVRLKAFYSDDTFVSIIQFFQLHASCHKERCLIRRENRILSIVRLSCACMISTWKEKRLQAPLNQCQWSRSQSETLSALLTFPSVPTHLHTNWRLLIRHVCLNELLHKLWRRELRQGGVIFAEKRRCWAATTTAWIIVQKSEPVSVRVNR